MYNMDMKQHPQQVTSSICIPLTAVFARTCVRGNLVLIDLVSLSLMHNVRRVSPVLGGCVRACVLACVVGCLSAVGTNSLSTVHRASLLLGLGGFWSVELVLRDALVVLTLVP